MEKASLPSPLYPLLNEINKAAEGGFPFLAVAMTIALPDICCSLSAADGRTSAQRYIDWCDTNLGDDFGGFVTGKDLYSMRCGVLHNGRFGDLKNNVARVIFALPGNATFANCQMNDAYVYSVVDFCRNFTQAVYRWFEAHRDEQIVQANVPRLMQYHPYGLSPYIVGMMVIA